MEKRIIIKNGVRIAAVHSDEVLISDTQSALDLIATISYDDECECIVLNQAAFAKEFFVLSSGVAGEVLQKVVNYRKKLAIVGDFAGYTSKPLQDFIVECNRGHSIFFVATEQEGIDRLARA